jgi:hypothetical protein
LNLKENIKKVLKEETNKLELVTNLIYDMFDNVGIEYNSKDNEIMVYYDKQEELVPIEICDVINNYTGLNVVPWYEYDKNRIGKEPDFYLDSEAYDEELNENYSPAGKEITPNNIVIHKSNPVWRENILKTGLQVSAGECYKTYVGYGVKCKPAIFATNSTNKRAWFDSTYDDDIWEINTEMIPDVKWYKDRHFESSKKHIVTFENIPADAITLKHEGTGKDWGLMESEDMTNDVEKNLKAIRLLLKQINWEGLCDIWVEYDSLDKEYAIKSKYIKKDFNNDTINKELDFLSNVIKSMGLKVYIYGPWFVDSCEDEVEFINESTFFRRRVDISLMDKEFFENLNYVTSIFLKRYNEGKRFDIFQFKTKVLNYLMDNYHGELSNGGLNDFPYDEIYEFLSNHFHDKIKDRYDTFFGNNINESEEKQPKYLNIIKDIVEPYKKEECVCDINVSFEDDMY